MFRSRFPLGTLLVGMVLRGESGPEALTIRRRIPMPPEPLRWAVAQGLMRSLQALDRRTDRRARPRARRAPQLSEETEPVRAPAGSP